MAQQQQKAQARAAEAKPAPRAFAPAPTPAPAPEIIAATAPNSVQDAQVRFDTVTASYQALVKQLQEVQVQMQEQEAQYKNRYKITHPAEVPAGPKRPVALIAMAIGLLSTIAAILMVAALADRFSGIFFEPRDVRDRLGLPVFATFS
jgi:capsular polysaccharide biosynthesis protein